MKTSKEFYTKLGIERLSKRKKKIHTKKELAYLKRIIKKNQKILDLACGYGRFTIPLAKTGYKIEGIDITPSFIKRAKQVAKKNRINVKFKVGDMRKLPYKNDEFDVIICMWSAFIELRSKKEQIKSIREMLRVLIKGGFALIELPVPFKIKKPVQFIKYEKEGDEFVLKKNSHIVIGKLAGIKCITYRYDKKTLIELMKKLKIKRYKIFIDKFGGRNRLFVRFWK